MGGPSAFSGGAPAQIPPTGTLGLAPWVACTASKMREERRVVGTKGMRARIVRLELLDLTREGTMKLKYRIKRWQMKKALRNNAGRIAVFAAAAAGLAVGIRGWRARA